MGCERIRDETGIVAMTDRKIHEPGHVFSIPMAGRTDRVARSCLASSFWTPHAEMAVGDRLENRPMPNLNGDDIADSQMVER